jgi:hypothetical protein
VEPQHSIQADSMVRRLNRVISRAAKLRHLGPRAPTS